MTSKTVWIVVMLIGLVLVAWALVRGELAEAPSSESEMAPTESQSAEADESSVFRPVIEVYNGISVPSNATELDLSDRQLSGSLKAEVRFLTKLETLDISNNQFTGLPAEVGQLRELRVLNLANNPLTGLPYELGNLTNLEVLDLRGTQYAAQDLEVISSTLPNTTTLLTD